MTTEKQSAQTEQRVEPTIDYKDVRYLLRFVSERGKIIPSRVSSQPIKRQREIAKAIKRARILALMPFVAD
ncbi:MAG: 30S ribosomal protein S18 [Holosporales bacterium]|jgi:small subunit ribosomal protein S18|nr:30S ribosomal protein S18 [Holosporales bacterium]